MIYLMRDDVTGLYKIGKSDSPVKRERTLLSQAPMIRLICYWNAPNQHENILHRLFHNKRRRGEWFDLDSDDLLEMYTFPFRRTDTQPVSQEFRAQILELDFQLTMQRSWYVKNLVQYIERSKADVRDISPGYTLAAMAHRNYPYAASYPE